MRRRAARRACRLLAAALLVGPATAAGVAPPPGYEPLAAVLAARGAERVAALDAVAASGDVGLVAGLVDALFFIPKAERGPAFAALAALTGARPAPARYLDWIDLVARHPEWRPRAGYAAWKGSLLARIDPAYAGLFPAGVATRIRLEEVVSGGVGVEGIPALDRPAVVPAAAARYLRPDEKVFGVSLGGETRAYPLRILGWHEMLNDVVGGRPVTLSYCTLCGSGVLYDAARGDGAPLTFGTSGLLHRSNKLMVDRDSGSLWSNLTGEAVVGPRAAAGDRLAPLPLTLTTWEDWRRRHPRTSVLDLDEARGRRFGFVYEPGAADRRRLGVAFPVGRRSDALAADAEVFALRRDGAARAYPLAALRRRGVVNDRVGGEPVVVVADRATGAARAYRAGDRTFAAAGDGTLRDQDGVGWRVEEEALVPAAGDGERLARLPGHHALWFAWQAFFPASELFVPPPGGGD